jgi:PAS domain-containing protein
MPSGALTRPGTPEESLTPEPPDLRQYVRQLTNELELWRAVADSLPDIVLQLDREGVVRYVNRGLDRSVLGRYFPDLVPDPAERGRRRTWSRRSWGRRGPIRATGSRSTRPSGTCRTTPSSSAARSSG